MTVSHTGSVSSACLNYDRRKVLVGTRGSEIFEFATNDESDLNKGPLVSGHCSGSRKIKQKRDARTYLRIVDMPFATAIQSAEQLLGGAVSLRGERRVAIIICPVAACARRADGRRRSHRRARAHCSACLWWTRRRGILRLERALMR